MVMHFLKPMLWRRAKTNQRKSSSLVALHNTSQCRPNNKQSQQLSEQSHVCTCKTNQQLALNVARWNQLQGLRKKYDHKTAVGSTNSGENETATSREPLSIVPGQERIHVSTHVIYSGAFPLANDVPAAVHETSPVLLYNLALLSHRSGIETGRTVFMSKALALSTKSLSVL
jgi:hypothetical protein